MAPVLDLAVSPHGSRVVTVAADGRVIAWSLPDQARQIWSNATDIERSSFAGAVGQLFPMGLLSLRPDELIVALRDQSIRRVKPSTGESAVIAPSRGSAYRRRPLFATPDGSAFARVTRAFAGPVYQLLQGLGEVELHLPNVKPERWHTPDASAAAALDRDHWLIGTLAGVLEVRAWKKAETSVVWLRRDSSVVDVDTSSTSAAAIWKDGHVAVFSNEGRLRFQSDNASGAETLRVSPDGRFVAFASGGSRALVRILDAESGRLLKEHPLSVSAIEFSKDGNWLALGSSVAEQLSVFSTRDWQLVTAWRYEGHRIASLAFSPDSRFVYSGGEEGLVREWSLGGLILALQRPVSELLATVTKDSGFTLRGLDPESKIAPVLSPTTTILITAPKAGPADRIVAAANAAKGIERGTEAKAVIKRLEEALVGCPGTGDKTFGLQRACAAGELSQARLAISSGQDMVAGIALRSVLERCDTVRTGGPAIEIASVLPLYSEAAALLEQMDPGLAAATLQTGIEEHKKLLLASPSVAPPLKELSLALERFERLIGKDLVRLEAFHRQTVDFLGRVRRRPELRELANDGYALYQFRLGRDLLELDRYDAAATALAEAAAEYKRQVGELVQTGHPMADQARQRWAEVIAYRALALATPYLPEQTASPLEADGQVLRQAMDEVESALSQIRILNDSGKGTRSTERLTAALERLKQEIIRELKPETTGSPQR
jgi:WD40 repeat protein